MIITVTLNTAIDKTLSVPNFRLGRRHRTVEQTTMPGGKGVNVARALLANGHDAVAVLPTGGPVGAQLMDLLAQEEVKAVGVPIAGPVRANITVAEPDGTVTKLNEPGPELSAAEIGRLLAETVRAAGDWVVGCGSRSTPPARRWPPPSTPARTC